MSLCSAAAADDTAPCKGSRTAVIVGLADDPGSQVTGCEFHAARRLAFWRDGYVMSRDAAVRRRVLDAAERLRAA
ncbi:hypothetical protein [Streptomyces sparsogenes]|uniref:hypothetical protein n=1 Tax=Streptomyces sparsogenes TaxID=67365 RepID=UPI000824FBF4|nr:hypothetical protein [Streptomyces sparsogenes]